MTILEIINKTTPFFELNNIESARLTCERMLSFVLKLTRVELYMQYDRPLSSKEMSTLREMVKRRKNREPLQYILGEIQYRDLNINLSPAVLIPRPETEIVIETAINALSDCSGKNVLDIGTGSGIIAMSIKNEISDSKVTACDISEYAIIVAKENAKRNNLDIEFIESNLFDNVNDKFDLIISNPPYVLASDINTLEPEVKDHEPKSALDGGKDGLSFYRSIISLANDYLIENGRIVFEIGMSQEKDIEQIAQEHSFVFTSVVEDLNNINRALVLKRK